MGGALPGEFRKPRLAGCGGDRPNRRTRAGCLNALRRRDQVRPENDFVHNEALANELAARFYPARGLETAGYAHLRNARNCYDRWGADGKVKQLDERHPRLREERPPASLNVTIGPSVRELDVEAVVKASQALSSEMVLPKLIERLMRIAVEHAGAERGLLILDRTASHGSKQRPPPDSGKIEVAARQALPSRRPIYLSPCCIM